ncbi:hypothetical protein ADMFC3_16720 [Geovibrio sp. ADMFC3]|jgi:Fe2+ transport system protein FeoA
MCSNLINDEGILCLSDAKKGEKCEISGFCKCCDRQSVRRLIDYGFIKGRTLEVVEEAGDGNVTVDLEGSRLCLCGSLSSKINITPCRHRHGRHR